MDQKIAVAGNTLTAIMLFFCALLVIPLGFGLLFSYPDVIWWLGLVLLVCGYIFIRSGISNLKLSSRMQKEADANLRNVADTLRQVKQQTTSTAIPVQEQSQIDAPFASAPAPMHASTQLVGKEVKILAHWTYTSEEWKKFTAWEIHERKSNTTIEAVLLVILGSLFVKWARDITWLWAIGLSLFIAVIYWVGKYFLSMASIGKVSGKQNEVVITKDAVIINGKYNAFNNEMYRLRSISIKEKPTPKVLEIAYEWSTRKGPTNDDIRIPIPGNKLAEAALLVETLKGF